MLLSNAVALVTLAASAQAFTFPSFPSLTKRAACPAVWTTISGELTKMFVTNFQCNDDARAAIRAVFHDCFPQGGCDGSISIASELARPENAPMTSTINKLKALAVKYKVGVADMLMFAGCNYIPLSHSLQGSPANILHSTCCHLMPWWSHHQDLYRPRRRQKTSSNWSAPQPRCHCRRGTLPLPAGRLFGTGPCSPHRRPLNKPTVHHRPV
jgi:hypothetical protein